jgi:hypothetical protein
MREGYGSRSVCVCLSGTALAVTYLVCMSKVSRDIAACRLLQICIVWNSLRTLYSGDTGLFACHGDRRFGFLDRKHTDGS